MSNHRHFYFNRIVRLWNSLPHIDLGLSINSIKATVYKHLWIHVTTHFNGARTTQFAHTAHSMTKSLLHSDWLINNNYFNHYV